METAENTIYENDKSIRINATVIHLSGFLKFSFPLLFIIAPILLWSSNRENSFIDKHGAQAINFHLSMMIYSLLLITVTVFLFIFSIFDFASFTQAYDLMGDDFSSITTNGWPIWLIWFLIIITLVVAKFFFEIIVMIVAALQASSGKLYKYPLTIQFLK